MKRFLKNKRGGDDTDVSHQAVNWLLLLLLFVVIVGGVVFYIIKTNKELPRMTQCGGNGLVSVGGQIGVCRPQSYPCSEGVPGVGCTGETPICCFDKETTSGVDLKKIGDETDEDACRRHGWKKPCELYINFMKLDTAQLKTSESFKVWCETNVIAPPCIRVKTLSDSSKQEITPGAVCEEYIDKDEMWKWSWLGDPGINISCQAPSSRGTYLIQCSIDPSCDSIDPNSKAVTLYVN